jgi:anti-sigma regulatory factor (Ser/Thr protein kinase)
MSTPAGGKQAGCLPGLRPAVASPPLAVRVFAGRREHAGRARAWVRAQVAAVCPALAGDAELAAAELVANAITHTRSGLPGGRFTVAVAAAFGGVMIHVHDQGDGSGQVPRPGPAAGRGGLAEGGRGLVIVAALSPAWGMLPVGRCPATQPRGPAADCGGCCTWCCLPAPHDPPAPAAGTRPAGAGRPGSGRDQR